MFLSEGGYRIEVSPNNPMVGRDKGREELKRGEEVNFIKKKVGAIDIGNGSQERRTSEMKMS